MSDDELLSVTEVIEILGVSRKMIHEYIKRGLLRARAKSPLPRSRVFVYRSSVEEFKRRRGEEIGTSEARTE